MLPCRRPLVRVAACLPPARSPSSLCRCLPRPRLPPPTCCPAIPACHPFCLPRKSLPRRGAGANAGAGGRNLPWDVPCARRDGLRAPRIRSGQRLFLWRSAIAHVALLSVCARVVPGAGCGVWGVGCGVWAACVRACVRACVHTCSSQPQHHAGGRGRATSRQEDAGAPCLISGHTLPAGRCARCSCGCCSGGCCSRLSSTVAAGWAAKKECQPGSLAACGVHAAGPRSTDISKPLAFRRGARQHALCA